ncbi:WD40 repeat domain-containing protein [Lentzea sp. PSKA42]|uniref:WD40 repeat domain-containing protein n=1 Tax=Lentzea indica TaxID=2604800 RepID=A0ABX1FNY1_9PSEU|nr:WD40 repeat domain-containing protein [Lentzea indica]NKE60708.1 WD40 repeat domain-containing protein [Lentzea indica]
MGDEITYFLAQEPRRPVYVVLAGGTLVWDRDTGRFDPEASDAMVPALAEAFPVEPLVVDVREAGRMTLADPVFRRSIARLLAPIRRKTVDELDDDDRLVQRRALRLTRGAVAALATLLVAAVTAGLIAVSNARAAKEQATRSTARYLAAQARQLLRSDIDLGMLAAVQSSLLEDSVGSRQALLLALQQDPLTIGTVRPDPDVQLDTVALSPSGRTVAATTNKSVRVWTVDRSLREVKARDVPGIRAIALPSDDEVLIASDSGLVTTWNIRTDRTEEWRPAEGVPFLDPSGELVAVVDKNNVVTIWRRDHTRVATLPTVTARPAVVVFSTDRTGVAVVADRTLSTFRLPGGEPAREPVPLDSGYADGVAVSPDLRHVVVDVRSADGHLALMDLTTGAVVKLPRMGGTTITAQFSRDGGKIITGEEGGRVGLYEVTKNFGSSYRVTAVPGHVGYVTALAVDAAGKLAASVDQTGRLILRDITIHDDMDNGPFVEAPRLRAGRSRVSSVGFDVSGARLLSSDGAGTTRLHDLRDGTARSLTNGGSRLGAHEIIGSALVGDQAFFLRDDDTLVRQHINDGTEERIGDIGQEAVVAASGDTVVTGDPNGKTLLWRRGDNGWSSRDLAGGSAEVTSAAISWDGRFAAIGRSPDRVDVWELAGPSKIDTIEGLDRGIIGLNSPVVAFQPGTANLAIGRGDGTVLMWDAVARTRSEPLVVSDKSIEAIAVSADGRLLAVGLANAPDATLYDLPSRQPIGTLQANLGTVTALGFAPDGGRLAAGDTSGRVAVFDTSVASWRDRLCRIAGRPITDAEWATLVGAADHPTACKT